MILRSATLGMGPIHGSSRFCCLNPDCSLCGRRPDRKLRICARITCSDLPRVSWGLVFETPERGPVLRGLEDEIPATYSHDPQRIDRVTLDRRLTSFLRLCLQKGPGPHCRRRPTDGAAQLENHHRLIASGHEGTDRSHLGFLRTNSFSAAFETAVPATRRWTSPGIAESSINPVSETTVIMRSTVVRFL